MPPKSIHSTSGGSASYREEEEEEEHKERGKGGEEENLERGMPLSTRVTSSRSFKSGLSSLPKKRREGKEKKKRGIPEEENEAVWEDVQEQIEKVLEREEEKQIKREEDKSFNWIGHLQQCMNGLSIVETERWSLIECRPTSASSGKEVPRVFQAWMDNPPSTDELDAQFFFSSLDMSPTVWELRFAPISSPIDTNSELVRLKRHGKDIAFVMELAPFVDRSMLDFLMAAPFPNLWTENLAMGSAIELVVELLRDMESAGVTHGSFTLANILLSYTGHIEEEPTNPEATADEFRLRVVPPPNLPPFWLSPSDRFRDGKLSELENQKADVWTWGAGEFPQSRAFPAFGPAPISGEERTAKPRWAGVIGFENASTLMFHPWLDAITLMRDVDDLLENVEDNDIGTEAEKKRLRLFEERLRHALIDSYEHRPMRSQPKMTSKKIRLRLRRDLDAIRDEYNIAKEREAKTFKEHQRALARKPIESAEAYTARLEERESWCHISLDQFDKIVDVVQFPHLKAELRKSTDPAEPCALLRAIVFSRVPDFANLIPTKFFGNGTYGAVLGFMPLRETERDDEMLRSEPGRTERQIRVFKLFTRVDRPGEVARQQAFAEKGLSPAVLMYKTIRHWTHDPKTGKGGSLHLLEMERIDGILIQWLKMQPLQIMNVIWDRWMTYASEGTIMVNTLGGMVEAVFVGAARTARVYVGDMFRSIILLLLQMKAFGITHGDFQYGNIAYVIYNEAKTQKAKLQVIDHGRSDLRKSNMVFDILTFITFSRRVYGNNSGFFTDLKEAKTSEGRRRVIRARQKDFVDAFNSWSSKEGLFVNSSTIINTPYIDMSHVETLVERYLFTRKAQDALQYIIWWRLNYLFEWYARETFPAPPSGVPVLTPEGRYAEQLARVLDATSVDVIKKEYDVALWKLYMPSLP